MVTASSFAAPRNPSPICRFDDAVQKIYLISRSPPKLLPRAVSCRGGPKAVVLCPPSLVAVTVRPRSPLDSEHFRPAPRTFDTFRGNLGVR
jgi:hypothetical protein